MTPDHVWRALAACRDMPISMFFPCPGARGERMARLAKEVCATCPVAEECLEYAMTTHQHFGVWGGTCERDRDRLRCHKRRRAS